MLIEDIYLFLYTIVTTFSKQWKFTTFSRHFHGTFSQRLMKKVVKMIFHDFFIKDDPHEIYAFKY